MMDKSLKWWIEKFGGPFLGIMLGIATFYFINPDGFLKDKATFVSKISDLGFIIFGFLLAFIGLIVNIKDKLVKAHGSDKIFNRTISFNIRVITLSVLTGLFGFILWIIYQSQNPINCTFSNVLLSFFSIGLGWLICDLGYFIIIFFKLIKKYS